MTAVETKPVAPTAARKLDPILKLVLEMGPLALFFVSNYRFGIYAATGVLMASVLVALATSYALTGRIPVMRIVSISAGGSLP